MERPCSPKLRSLECGHWDCFLQSQMYTQLLQLTVNHNPIQPHSISFANMVPLRCDIYCSEKHALYSEMSASSHGSPEVSILQAR